MKKIALIAFTFLTLHGPGLQSYAAPLPQSKTDFCGRFESSSATIQELSSESGNLMSFKNTGGLFNQGVCWWHSRFQRNIFYLAIFRPDLPKPATRYELLNIIRKIRLGKSVVTIPGYKNLEEFSSLNQKAIQAELDDWQFYDGVIMGGWIDGLEGETEVASNVLKSMMDQVFEYVAVKKKIAYEKLQIEGITAHAWLIVGMKKQENGFDIGLIDSNNPRMTELYSYKTGDKSFYVKGYGNFVPYLGFVREEERLISAAKTFCGIKALVASEEQQDIDYQLDLEEAKN